MANIIEKFKANWKKKSLFAKITDIVFYTLIISILIPQSRIEVLGFVNGIRAKIVSPSIKKETEVKTVNSSDLDWVLYDLQGNKHNLSESKGKVIFVNLWATWCPPCVGEMPGIQDLYNKFKNNDKVAFYIITDEPVEKAKEFISKRDYDFPVYSSTGVNPEKFGTQTIPVTFLVSPEGNILIRQVGAANWGGEKMEKIINDLLNK
jgi:thiol-disulfide isomerase/thioredoxin